MRRRGLVWAAMGCPAPHGGRGLILPRFLYIFELKMASFGALWELFLLQLNCLSYTHKPVSLELWLAKAAIASLCQKSGGGLLHDCSPA